MASHSRLDRREFLALSALTSVATLLPESVYASQSSETDGISLETTGDAQNGYGVTILYRGRAIARHRNGGEFSAVFQNDERSLEDRVDDWKAASWKGDGRQVHLSGEMQLINLRTTVFVEVRYEIVSTQVIKKTIHLRQADMFALLYQITNRLDPETVPAKLWSFDHADCKGGALHEYFPAAGFRTQNGVTVGLLTDSGYRNQWSRIIRRDGTPVKPAPARIPDLNLYSLPNIADRAERGSFIQQTFGESTVQMSGEGSHIRVDLAAPSAWKKSGNVKVEQQDGVVKLSPSTVKDFVLVPLSARGGDIYSVALKYRSAVPVSIHAWDVDDEFHKLGDLTLFNDTAPASPSVFAEFHHSFVVPALQGVGAAIVLSLPDFLAEAELRSEGGKLPSFEVSDLEVSRIVTRNEPYHRLEMDRPQSKTTFIFVSDTVLDTLSGYRLASQLHLADGMGFKGGDTEKVLYADVMMLSWIGEQEGLRPMLAPSIWYSAAGEMYLRDSFYSLNGIYDRTLNEKVFALWADNQGEDGAINTLVEPKIANLERKSNDSTPLWLMWALLNRRRFGTKLPMDKVRRAAEYCLAAYDPKREAVCTAKFVMGQLDVIQYPEGTSILCENQGMLAVLLRTIRELEIPQLSATIAENYIAKAEAGYRSYYDASLGFLCPSRNIRDAIGFADIFPEFLSLWLFNRKILTDEMVISHLNRIPVMLPRNNCPFPEEGGSVRPIFIGLPQGGKDWSYFNEKWHPMVSDSYAAGYANKAADGVYYNGGSWMRIEICGYVTGKLHGWEKSEHAIANRMWAELHIDENYPTSQEYLPTDERNRFFGYHRVFAWNAFVLRALEMIKLRSQEMDPGHLE
ncbi:hypothetical protein P8935_02495 [Telmatobacter sp. DSM 110680]|uniref:Uncharacterized protein n=1 Tax=Telmatobacter sp. DSM 110680 TaxID=3036704 RepID=A0AAU7DLM4_9BACT